MSFNFRDIYPVVSTITLDPYEAIGSPNKPSAVQGPTEGTIWNDSVYHNFQAYVAGQATSLVTIPSVISVANKVASGANPGTGAVNLMSYAFPAIYTPTQAGTSCALDAPGHLLTIFGGGNFTTASGQTPTFTLAITLGGVTIFTWTSGATTASTTTAPWNFDAQFAIATGGATGTGFGHGTFNISLAGAAMTTYGDANTAAITNIPLNAATTLQVTGTLSTSASTDQFTQDFMTIQVA